MNTYCDLHQHTSPVVLGTDNALNFSTNFQREKEFFFEAFSYNLANGWNCRFGQSHCIEG